MQTHSHQFVEKVGQVAAPAVAFVVAQMEAATSVLPDLPGWLDGTFAGLLILALVYSLRWVTRRMERSETALAEFKDGQIAELKEENRLLREQLSMAGREETP